MDRSEAIAACPEGYVVATERKWANGDLCAACYVVEGQEVIASDLLDDHGCGVWYIPLDLAAPALEKARQERERLAWLNEPAPPEAVEEYKRWAALPTYEEMVAFHASSRLLHEWQLRVEHQYPHLKVDPIARIPIPDHALRAYERYRGDPERAWEAGDEEAWATIREWGPLIERSRASRVRKPLGEEVQDALHEDMDGQRYG